MKISDNGRLLEAILNEKGYTIHKVYQLFGDKRVVYKAFQDNLFSREFIKKLEKLVGEDLSFFINCYTRNDVKEINNERNKARANTTNSKRSHWV